MTRLAELLTDPEVRTAFELLQSRGVGILDYAAWCAEVRAIANRVERSESAGYEPRRCGYSSRALASALVCYTASSCRTRSPRRPHE